MMAAATSRDEHIRKPSWGHARHMTALIISKETQYGISCRNLHMNMPEGNMPSLPLHRNQEGCAEMSRRQPPLNQPPEEYGDLATVNSQQNDIIPEEFPEGAYGSSLPVFSLGKSSPWRADQYAKRPFGYENIELHQGIPREYPDEDTQGEV